MPGRSSADCAALLRRAAALMAACSLVLSLEIHGAIKAYARALNPASLRIMNCS